MEILDNDELLDLDEKKLAEIDAKRTEDEEYYDVDTLEEMEKKEGMVRYEMNVVELPFFSKDKKVKVNEIKTYHFSKRRNTFMRVIPGLDRKIPLEFAEKLFIVLLQIQKENGYSKTIYTDINYLIDKLNIQVNGKNRRLIWEAILDLSRTTYVFNNVYYLKENQDQKGMIVKDLLETRILEEVRKIKVEDMKDEDKNHVRNSYVKEIIKITFSTYIQTNIVNKGYLLFNSKQLLGIKSSVTRSIYQMIEKWRNNKEEMTVFSKRLASRIPLSWKKENISSTVSRLKRSFKELEEMELIKSAKFFRNGHNEESYFMVVFNNSRLSQAYYVTGQENMEIEDIESFENINNDNGVKNPVISTLEPLSFGVDKNQIEEIYMIFPLKARELKSLKRNIKSALEKYDFDYVKYNAEYTVLNAKRSYLKYFSGSLENNWAEEYTKNKKDNVKKEAKKVEEVQEPIEIVKEVNSEKTKILDEFYEKMDSEGKKLFKNRVYNEIDRVSDAPLPQAVKETMFRKSNYRYKILEELYNNRNSGFVVEEMFNNISQFGVRVYKELSNAKLEDYLNEVSFSLKTFEFCDIEDDKVKIDIKYDSNGMSHIKILKK